MDVAASARSLVRGVLALLIIAMSFMRRLLMTFDHWKHASAIIAMLLTLFLPGCQTWQSSTGIPGLDGWSEDSKIEKSAKNDPFPSPQQVGLK